MVVVVVVVVIVRLGLLLTRPSRSIAGKRLLRVNFLGAGVDARAAGLPMWKPINTASALSPDAFFLFSFSFFWGGNAPPPPSALGALNGILQVMPLVLGAKLSVSWSFEFFRSLYAC